MTDLDDRCLDTFPEWLRSLASDATDLAALLASPDIPVPFTPVLENAYRPDAGRIAEAARRLVAAD